jgi:hypothetical protein
VLIHGLAAHAQALVRALELELPVEPESVTLARLTAGQEVERRLLLSLALIDSRDLSPEMARVARDREELARLLRRLLVFRPALAPEQLAWWLDPPAPPAIAPPARPKIGAELAGYLQAAVPASLDELFALTGGLARGERRKLRPVSAPAPAAPSK